MIRRRLPVRWCNGHSHVQYMYMAFTLRAAWLEFWFWFWVGVGRVWWPEAVDMRSPLQTDRSFTGRSTGRKGGARLARDAPPQDAAPQMTQRTSWLCSYVVGQEIPEVSYPTDLSNGYKIGPECRKNSKCTWNRQQMAQYGSPARHTCLGGVLQSCLGVYDYSGFHFCWSLRSKPSR